LPQPSICCRTNLFPPKRVRSKLYPIHTLCKLRFPQATDNGIKPRKGCNVHGEWTWEFRNKKHRTKCHQVSYHPNAIAIVQNFSRSSQTPEDEMRTKIFHVRDELVNSTCEIKCFCTNEHSEDHRYTRGSLTSLRSSVPSLLV
jgi:hypothetical protein